MGVHPDRRALGADLGGPQQRVFASTRAVVSLRAFAADPGGLVFLADILAENVSDADVAFAFTAHTHPGTDACSIRVACAGPGGSWPTPRECHLQGGGGQVAGGLGRWTFELRAPLPRRDYVTNVRMFLSWERMALAEACFDIDGMTIARAARRSRGICTRTGPDGPPANASR